MRSILSLTWITFVTKRKGITCIRYLFKVTAIRKKQNRPKEWVDFQRRFLFSFSEGSRQVSLHVLELYNQVSGRSHLFCVASLFKRMFTTFWGTFVPERVPSSSPFAWYHQPERVQPHSFCTGATISFRFEISQQHRVTKNNHSFLYEINLSVDCNE